MEHIKNVTGINKKITKLKIIIHVFLYFLPRFFNGSLSLRRFVQLLRRLLFFVNRMDENKYVSIGGRTRINLYIPGYPSKAFFRSCEKFMEFDNKMPCATVLISVTSACRYSCEHCYQKLDKGSDLEIEKLVETVQKLQDMGIVFFNIEGGDPFLTWDRLITVCRAIDDRSEIWINSTGDGITEERLLELKKTPVTAIMFSLRETNPDKYDELMGKPGAWQTAVKGMEACHKAGIAVAMNSCISKSDFFNGNFEKIMDKTKELKAAIIQIIHPKPAGGWLESGTDKFTKNDLEKIETLIHSYNLSAKYRDYPSISAQILEEHKNRFGCTAGGNDRFYINAKGDIQPCEFLNISYGNLKDESFETIYERMRDSFKYCGTCWLCEEYSAKVHEIFKENNLTTLPLTPELSKKVYENWDIGKETPLYEKIKKMR